MIIVGFATNNLEESWEFYQKISIEMTIKSFSVI